MHARNALRWVLAAAYGVLWLGGIVSRWVPARLATPPWAAPLFLLLSAAILALDAVTLWPVVLFAAGGFLAELAGVHTGFPFGRYSYSGTLGPALGGVPLTIGCAWVTLLVWARDLGWRITPNFWAAVICGAGLMTVVDLLIDPVATRILGYWHWDQDGIFFGVPLTNFLGWFSVSAVLLWIAGRPARASTTALLIGIATICFFALMAWIG